MLPVSLKELPIDIHSEETSQNEHPDSSDGVGVLPGPPSEFGVAMLPDERKSSQENTPNAGTLHSETATANLPEDRTQQPLNDSHPLMTEKALPEVKEEVGTAPLPDERKSDGASKDASIGLLRDMPSTKMQNRDFFSDAAYH